VGALHPPPRRGPSVGWTRARPSPPPGGTRYPRAVVRSVLPCLALLLGACGRIGFDPLGTETDGGTGPGGDGASPDTMGPAGAGTCAAPVALGFGDTIIDTCLATDVEVGCSAGAPDVVVVFTPPATAYYDVIASASLTFGTSLSPACNSGICTGSVGMTFQAGVAYPFVVEAMGGGCAQGSITLQ